MPKRLSIQLVNKILIIRFGWYSVGIRLVKKTNQRRIIIVKHEKNENAVVEIKGE